MLATLQIVPRLQIFITSYHTLALFIKTDPLDWKKNYVGIFTISSQADFLSHLITPYHSLSSRLKKKKDFILATLKLVPKLQIFYHILSCLVTPYHNLVP